MSVRYEPRSSVKQLSLILAGCLMVVAACSAAASRADPEAASRLRPVHSSGDARTVPSGAVASNSSAVAPAPASRAVPLSSADPGHAASQTKPSCTTAVDCFQRGQLLFFGELPPGQLKPMPKKIARDKVTPTAYDECWQDGPRTFERRHAVICRRLAEGAQAAYAEGCRLRHGESCHMWAQMALRGWGVPESRATAVARWKQGCALDDGRCCFKWGAESRGDKSVSFTALYTKACDLGHWEGCFALASSYERGWGVDKDEQKARKLLARGMAAAETGCKVGDFLACDRMYVEGVMKAKAMETIDARCKRGRRTACLVMSILLGKSQKARSRRAFERGCWGAFGSSESCRTFLGGGK